MTFKVTPQGHRQCRHSIQHIPLPISHTRTVVRECCKGDDQSQWRRANFDPPPPLSPLTDLHQNWQSDYVGDIYHHAKFYSDRIRGFTSAHARLRAPLLTRLSFFWVLEITYSQDATTDIDAQYVKIRGSVQGCAFWGSENHTLRSTSPFSLKIAILGPDYDGT